MRQVLGAVMVFVSMRAQELPIKNSTTGVTTATLCMALRDHGRTFYALRFAGNRAGPLIGMQDACLSLFDSSAIVASEVERIVEVPRDYRTLGACIGLATGIITALLLPAKATNNNATKEQYTGYRLGMGVALALVGGITGYLIGSPFQHELINV
jgi:hypothetical protein